MTPTQRAEWLIERRTGIGASDAAAAVGLSKWKTPLELWMDKKGEYSFEGNEATRWGGLLEPVVRQEAADRLGITIEVPNRIIRHPTVSFAIATVDGIGFPSHGPKRMYEGKTARSADGWGEPGSAEIPQDYFFQCQHGMFVTRLEVTDVAVLIGGSDFRLYEVPADPDFQKMLIEQEAEFWNLVQSNTPPEPVNAEDVKRRWKLSSGKQFLAGQPEAEKSLLLRRAKDMAKFLDARIEELTTDLQAQMKDCGELIGPDGETLATWNNIKTNPRFDLERFKEEHPELHASYLKDPGHQRRFLLKLKASEKPIEIPGLASPPPARIEQDPEIPPVESPKKKGRAKRVKSKS